MTNVKGIRNDGNVMRNKTLFDHPYAGIIRIRFRVPAKADLSLSKAPLGNANSARRLLLNGADGTI